MAVSSRALDGRGTTQLGCRMRSWSFCWRSEAMKETRRDLASENLLWEKRGGRIQRRTCGEAERDGE